MSIYKSYGIDEVQELQSNYLINNWSYSKVTAFARNEKAFEMAYIFGVYSRKSATSIAGQAYHHALERFFKEMKETGNQLDLVELEQTAFAYVDEIPANQWKLQKTTPTIEECVIKANKTVSDLLRNFIGEIDCYLNDIEEIIGIEVRVSAWLTINGVDIPMPCDMKIDLIVRTKAGKVAIIDHKSKSTYTSEDEIALSIGVQAITYTLGYEEHSGLRVDEVWFMENKPSKNKNGEPQISDFRIVIDNNTRKLYEALLYEPLKRMLQAVNDPDYTYLINESDNLTDKAELYDFWARTMICEVEDFNVEESKKDLVSKRLKKVRDASITTISPAVIKTFKENAAKFIQYDLSKTNMTNAEKIEHVLRSLGTIVKVAHEIDGYSSNTYLIEVSAGVKVGSIYPKRLDIANALNVSNVRISPELVIYEGKSYIGIESSKKRDKDLPFDSAALVDRKIPVGKDNFDQVVHWDLDNHSTPHAIVCGATGSGKSVFLLSTIAYAQLAGVDDVVIFDPKFDEAFSNLGNNYDVNVYHDIEDIEEQIANLVKLMEQLIREKKKKLILVIFDEYADAIMNARSGNDLKVYGEVKVGEYASGLPKFQRKQIDELKSLGENLQILLQKGRSVGFRIVAATQRASTKIITGDAKVNFPVQICFRVPKEIDSKVVLDEPGAESLSGYGDGLIKSPEYPSVVRFQGFYKADGKVASRVSNQHSYIETIED